MVARTLAVGPGAVNDDNHSVGREPAIREDAGNKPALQVDVIARSRDDLRWSGAKRSRKENKRKMHTRQSALE